MYKKIILVLAGIFLFFGWHMAQASVIINEFVSHPNSGEKEWVEIFNNNRGSQDLSGWKLTELTSPSTNPKEEKLLDLSGVLSDSNNEILVFEFTSKLNDSGDSIGLYDDSNNLVYRVTYGTDSTVKNYSIDLAAPSIGKSGALINNVWKTDQDQTKSIENSNITLESDSVSTSSNLPANSSSAQETTEIKTKTIETPQIKTKIIAKTTAFVGIPVEFKSSATGYSNEPLFYGKYFWNFGDGDSKEIKANEATAFTHTFFYAGEYTVALEYSENYYSPNPDASNKITIRVVPADISISKVGDEKDFFVEISNNTDYDADISRWVLATAEKNFVLPGNTILKSKSKMIISPKITGFSVLDKDTLKLLNGEGETIFDYSSSIKPAEILAGNPVQIKISTAKSVQNILPKDAIENNTDTQMPVDNLAAEAVKSDTNTNTKTKDNFKYGIFGLFAFLGAGTSATYFIRSRNRKTVSKASGNDFEIIDE